MPTSPRTPPWRRQLNTITTCSHQRLREGRPAAARPAPPRRHAGRRPLPDAITYSAAVSACEGPASGSWPRGSSTACLITSRCLTPSPADSRQRLGDGRPAAAGPALSVTCLIGDCCVRHHLQCSHQRLRGDRPAAAGPGAPPRQARLPAAAFTTTYNAAISACGEGRPATAGPAAPTLRA